MDFLLNPQSETIADMIDGRRSDAAASEAEASLEELRGEVEVLMERVIETVALARAGVIGNRMALDRIEALAIGWSA